MQTAARVEYDHLNWLWGTYDTILNRGDPTLFLTAVHECRNSNFNGKRMSTGGDVADAYASLRATLPNRRFKLDRSSIDFDVVIGPETFANCASVWWIVESSPDAAWPGNPVFGATQILFRGKGEIIQIRDLWAPLP